MNFTDRHGFWGGRRLRRFPQGAEVSVSKSEPLVAEQVERADFSSADICSAKPPAVPEAVKRHRKPPEGRVLQGFHEPPPKSVTVRKVRYKLRRACLSQGGKRDRSDIDKMGSFGLCFGDATNSAGRSWWNGFSLALASWCAT